MDFLSGRPVGSLTYVPPTEHRDGPALNARTPDVAGGSTTACNLFAIFLDEHMSEWLAKHTHLVCQVVHRQVELVGDRACRLPGAHHEHVSLPRAERALLAVVLLVAAVELHKLHALLGDEGLVIHQVAHEGVTQEVRFLEAQAKVRRIHDVQKAAAERGSSSRHWECKRLPCPHHQTLRRDRKLHPWSKAAHGLPLTSLIISTLLLLAAREVGALLGVATLVTTARLLVKPRPALWPGVRIMA